MNKTDTAILLLLFTAVWLLVILLTLMLVDAGADCMQAVPSPAPQMRGMLV
jgi:hypothetical protein